MRSETAGWSRPVAVRTEVAGIGHRATRDVRRTREEQALREAHCISDLARSETSTAELPDTPPDVTTLVIPRGPEHQDLINVYSCPRNRFRSACCGRTDLYAQDVSAVCTIKEAKR